MEDKPVCVICGKKILSGDYKNDKGLVVAFNIFDLPKAYHHECAYGLRPEFTLWFLGKIVRRDFKDMKKELKRTATDDTMPYISGWGVINSPLNTVLSIVFTLVALLFPG